MPINQNRQELIKVFFYGTLKRNQPNSDCLLNKNVTFLSEAITVDKYPLIIASDFNIPFLLNKKGYGKNIHGEMYLIDQEAKEFFDDFEGVQDNLYTPFQIEVIDKKTNQIHQVWSYLLDDFRHDLLNENTILFDNYSSVNNFYSEYEKQKDSPDNLSIVYNAVKAQKRNLKND